MKHCCRAMAEQLDHECDQHLDPADCPDSLVARFGKQYGLRIHDGGSSFVVIHHCPWCGSKLGTSKAAIRRPTV